MGSVVISVPEGAVQGSTVNSGQKISVSVLFVYSVKKSNFFW